MLSEGRGTYDFSKLNVVKSGLILSNSNFGLRSRYRFQTLVLEMSDVEAGGSSSRFGRLRKPLAPAYLSLTASNILKFKLVLHSFL